VPADTKEKAPGEVAEESPGGDETDGVGAVAGGGACRAFSIAVMSLISVMVVYKERKN
jgi:hypothetical protein